MIEVIYFSVTEQLTRWASGYKEHASIEYYLKDAIFEFYPEFNTIVISWPEYVKGELNTLGMEARHEFPLMYEAINEANQELIFPGWLDSYNLAVRFGARIRTFRSPIKCQNCAFDL